MKLDATWSATLTCFDYSLLQNFALFSKKGIKRYSRITEEAAYIRSLHETVTLKPTMITMEERGFASCKHGYVFPGGYIDWFGEQNAKF